MDEFVVADLNAVEPRILSWLADCRPLMNVFAAGKCPYRDFAAWMYKTTYDEITKNDPRRQVAKSAVLGAGFQLSGGELKMDCCWRLVAECDCKEKGDEAKTGLWAYANNMKIEMDRETAHEAVNAYRDRYREVVETWYALEDAAVNAVITGRQIQTHHLIFGTVPEKVLWILLPSGRRLHYLMPRLEPGKFKRPSLTHYTHSLKGWIREQLYGGRLVENAVQAIARDVLAEGMLRADAAGMEIVGHCHDEIICLERVSHEDPLALLIRCMTEMLPWAPNLILGADGYSGQIYKK